MSKVTEVEEDRVASGTGVARMRLVKGQWALREMVGWGPDRSLIGQEDIGLFLLGPFAFILLNSKSVCFPLSGLLRK